MGNTYIALKAMFEELGAEVVLPPKSNKRTLELGTKYAPESICIPFKLTLGNYMESIEKGADTLFMWSGCDVCRIGYYQALHRNILKKLGYEFELICVEPFKSFQEIKEVLDKLKIVSNKKGYYHLIPIFVKGIQLIHRIDKLDELICRIRPRAVDSRVVEGLNNDFQQEILQARGCDEAVGIIKKYEEAFEGVQADSEGTIIKIGIIGEIYTVLDPFINQDLVKNLGHMGVEVHCSVTASEFIREQIDFLPFVYSNKEAIHQWARPYLDREIGGHARHSIGNAVRFGEEAFDGVIHLMPFTCMPEIVAQSILPTIEREKNIPVLKLILDEMTGIGGYQTRVEAFVDLLRRRKLGKNLCKHI